MALSAARLRRPNAKGDGPPVLSREFLIQNHADIISCVCVVIFLGLIPQVYSNVQIVRIACATTCAVSEKHFRPV